MINKYYQDELAYLREMGRDFARIYPEAAHFVGEASQDPDVERLLEGFAFLTARVRQKLEDELPELTHTLLETFFPHYLRPIPSFTVIQFEALPQSAREVRKIPRGVEIDSAPVDGTACRFRTTADLDLLPIAVQDVLFDQSVGGQPVLKVQLQLAPQAVAAAFEPDGIRFLLHGELPVAATLLLALARHLRGIRLRALPSGKPVELPASALRLSGPA
jgi:type VI secretion system protein ImpG